MLNEGIIAAVIGWVVLILVGSYSIPQFIKIIKTKNTSSLSIVSYTAFIISSALMAAWGVGNAVRGLTTPGNERWLVYFVLVPNFLANLLNTTIDVISLIIKINHVHLAKKYKINEIQLASKLLKAKKGGAK